LNKNKIIGIILSGVMLLSLGVNGVIASNVATGSVKINTSESDKQVIENIIRRKIDKAIGKLTYADFAKVTDISLNGWKVKDISSLNKLTNLKTLNLYSNNVSDVSVLTKLTKLDYLVLDENKITDISPLKNLTKIKYLELTFNKVKNISSLKNLTNLTTLNLYNNQVKDISVLKNLTKLNTLIINRNQISDISVLKGLSNLSYVSLAGNPKVTKLQINQLKKALPKCHIEY
jgi:internalin A